MKLSQTLLAACAIASLAAPAAATVTLVTTDAGYTGPDLDLSGYDNGNYNFTFGPIIVGDFTFTAAPGGGGNSGSGSVVGQGGYGLGSNGSFGGDAVYIGVDSATGYADLVLNTGPVSQLGFFFNYCPDCGGDAPTIWALDSGGNPFAAFDLSVLAPISTPGGFNDFEFRGLVDDAGANIYGLRLGGGYILASGTATGDVVTPPNGAVPEPATWAMMLLGFGAVGFAMRYQRRKPSVRFAAA